MTAKAQHNDLREFWKSVLDNESLLPESVPIVDETIALLAKLKTVVTTLDELEEAIDEEQLEAFDAYSEHEALMVEAMDIRDAGRHLTDLIKQYRDGQSKLRFAKG